jgi:hypothetical protein
LNVAITFRVMMLARKPINRSKPQNNSAKRIQRLRILNPTDQREPVGLVPKALGKASLASVALS